VPKPSLVPGREKPIEAECALGELGMKGGSVESVAAGTRRRFSASEKLRLVQAAEGALASGVRGALGGLLRREGIYSSHLSAWRQQLGARGVAGLTAQKPGRKPRLGEKDRELLAVTKENVALKRKLQVANALLGLQKKAHELLGLALPGIDEAS